MGSEPAAHGRLLWEADGGGRRYISYDALRGDAVPCSRPGVPYYNCRKCLAQMVLLAVPRVVMSTFLLGILVKWTAQRNRSRHYVAPLKDLGSSKKAQYNY
ncbi:rapid alkalinization factor 23-like [Hordeum vulgare]|nr:rapid alkalinization factor 23-like [Hordeum vulgare]